MSKSIKRNKLGCEKLETRELMANNVTAFVTSAGDLQILGDSGGNQVLVRDLGGNRYMVSGMEGTTVNGQTFQNFSVTSDRLFASLGAGNDGIFVDASVIGSINIKTGMGGDLVFVTNTIVSNSVVINTGSELDKSSDWVGFGNDRFFGNVSVSMGGGDDLFATVDTTYNESLSVYGGSGHDKFRWRNSSYWRLGAWSSLEEAI